MRLRNFVPAFPDSSVIFFIVRVSDHHRYDHKWDVLAELADQHCGDGGREYGFCGLHWRHRRQYGHSRHFELDV
jgi:hypothetical protein